MEKDDQDDIESYNGPDNRIYNMLEPLQFLSNTLMIM